VIDQLENGDLLAGAEAQARIIRERLDPLADEDGLVGEVRGLGPMVGIELVTDRKTKEPAALATAAVVKRCHENGLLILKCGTHDNVVRLLAPLVTPEEDLHRGLEILTEALRSVST
jgi:4-aminobutyrate aminotransferase/(S)-3-amino-2-methylpropionate transaminase